MIYVIGIGPGNIKYMNTEAIRLIENAEKIAGGKRNIEAVANIVDLRGKEIEYITSDLSKLREYLKNNEGKEVSILASGDPSLYGIGDFILREFEDVVLVPGISSIQYAFSAFKINMNDVYITSAHGRLPDYDLIFMHDKIAMVTDRKTGPAEIASEIKKRKLNYRIYVGENLTYSDEKLYNGYADDIIEKAEYAMSVVILIREKSYEK